MANPDPEEKTCASALAEAWEKVTSIRRKAQKLKAVRAWEVVRSTLANSHMKLLVFKKSVFFGHS